MCIYIRVFEKSFDEIGIVDLHALATEHFLDSESGKLPDKRLLGEYKPVILRVSMVKMVKWRICCLKNRNKFLQRLGIMCLILNLLIQPNHISFT